MKEKFVRAHMAVAWIYSKLSYCKRRQVGCVIVKEERIISIGYNGTPSGWDNNCEDENNVTYPYVLHAETNALSKLARSHESGRDASMFVTTIPCLDCAKLISQTGIKEVFYSETYRSEEGVKFLKESGIPVYKVDKSELTNLKNNIEGEIVAV